MRNAAAGKAPLTPFLRAGSRDPLRGTAASTKRPVLVFEGVRKSFRAANGDDRMVLRGVDLEIERGEFVFVTGPSGSGKSTLLKILYRAEQIDDGRILFCGRDVCRLTDESVPFLRRNLGIVFQDFKIVPNWTVAQNVAVTLEVLGISTRLTRQRVTVALERVGLAGRGGDRAGVLSGGEQQRVAIARAIVGEPALVLADEPTGNLDPALAIDILGLFEEIHAAGTTVMFATHDRTLLDVQPRRILVLDEGRVTDVRSGLRAADDEDDEDDEADEADDDAAIDGADHGEADGYDGHADVAHEEAFSPRLRAAV
jgi:cell division transport system ATP-binding protein